jgi:hypothetical protein
MDAAVITSYSDFFLTISYPKLGPQQVLRPNL